MPEVVITKRQNIVVGKVETNSYGDLLVKDKDGNSFPKIGVKRIGYFKDTLIEGNAVQLNFAKAYDKEYIYSAELVKDKLPTPVTPPMPQTKDDKEVHEPESSRDKRIDKAVWFKELGECLRSGYFNKATPTGKALGMFYYAEMCKVLDIQIEKE